MHAWRNILFVLVLAMPASMTIAADNTLLGTWKVSKVPNYSNGTPYHCPVTLIFTAKRQQIIYADGRGAGDNHMDVQYVVSPGQVRVAGNTGSGIRFNFIDANTVHFFEAGCDYTRAR